jgi:hypothetical protein
MSARTGRIHIRSDRGEGPLVDLPIRALEGALHEAHVRIHEREDLDLTCRRVELHQRPADEREAHEPIEVNDGRRFGIRGIAQPGGVQSRCQFIFRCIK